jgi:Leucine-rich repeat (LRR) protein
MNRPALRLLIGLLLLPLGCGSPTGPQRSEFCRAQGDDGIVTFEDANLEAAVRAELSVGAQEDLTCGLVSGLTLLRAFSAGIESLVGIQNFTSLRSLFLESNSISDISALSGLTGLEGLSLSGNSITDVGALRGLTDLRGIDLDNNPDLTDIQPLLDNTGFGAGDHVLLGGTNVSCADVAALEAKGVEVFSDCP